MASSTTPSTIPVLTTPIDALRAGGTTSFKHTATALHPMESVQQAQCANEWETSLRLTAMAHGQASALEKRMDHAALSKIQRLPGGPPSSHALLDSWLGRDGSVGFEDVLNCECVSFNVLPLFSLPTLFGVWSFTLDLPTCQVCWSWKGTHPPTHL